MRALFFVFISIVTLFSAKVFAHPSPGVDQLCAQYPYLSDQTACLEKFKAKRVSAPAMNLCGQYPYLSDKVQCALDLSDMYMDPAAQQLCAQYPYMSDKKSCLIDLSNLRFDQSTVTTCNQYPYMNDKRACMKRLGDPSSGAGSGRTVADQVATALNSIRAGNTAQAEALLTDLNNDLARHPNMCR